MRPADCCTSLYCMCSAFVAQAPTSFAGDALAALDAAAALEPELIDLCTARCRVLKHAGDLAGAAAAAVQAQGMDMADRHACNAGLPRMGGKVLGLKVSGFSRRGQARCLQCRASTIGWCLVWGVALLRGHFKGSLL